MMKNKQETKNVPLITLQIKNATCTQSGTKCIMPAGRPLQVMDISLTWVKYNRLLFINIQEGLQNLARHLVKSTARD